MKDKSENEKVKAVGKVILGLPHAVEVIFRAALPEHNKAAIDDIKAFFHIGFARNFMPIPGSYKVKVENLSKSPLGRSRPIDQCG